MAYADKRLFSVVQRSTSLYQIWIPIKIRLLLPYETVKPLRISPGFFQYSETKWFCADNATGKYDDDFRFGNAPSLRHSTPIHIIPHFPNSVHNPIPTLLL